MCLDLVWDSKKNKKDIGVSKMFVAQFDKKVEQVLLTF